MKNTKKHIFLLGICIAFAFGLSIESQSSTLFFSKEPQKKGVAKCYLKIEKAKGSSADYCLNNVCVEQKDNVGNNFARCTKKSKQKRERWRKKQD